MNLREHLILYVDDEHSNRVVFEQTFGRILRVRCVGSGVQALEVLAAEPVAVLVTDQRMPGLTGDQLLAKARALYPNTLRIVVTAYSDIDPILHAVNQGLVVRYIIKPWNRPELEDILKWALEAYVLGTHDAALQLRLIQTERLLTLGQVAATILHDVASPLQSIVYNASKLREYSGLSAVLARLASDLDARLGSDERERLLELAADLSEVVQDISQGVGHVVSVVDQLRSFMTRSVPTGEPVEADALAVIRFALSMCRDVGVDSATVSYDAPVDLPIVRASATELSQVLINLVRNALQALHEGGNGRPSGHVRVLASEDRDTVRFVVCDDGPGMSDAVLARIGTAFYTTRSGGTGLGIAHCKRIVGRLGGEIEIESTVGKGTTVTVRVPKA